MRRFLLIAALLFSAVPAFGQALAFHDVVLSGNGQPLGGAPITVCASTATGVPCSPVSMIFSNATGTPLANPTATDGLGNIQFWATAGNYQLCVGGTAVIPYCYYFTLGGGGGGASGAAGVTGNVQYNGGAGTFAGAAGLNTEDGNNLRIKGTVPLVDVTAFGVRSFTGGIPQTTATCQSGSPNITLASNSGAFAILNGDGFTAYGCGPTNTLATPSAPTVTPATSAGETTTGWYANIPAGVAGSTTACYKVRARDLQGGITAASTSTCTSTGQATLGLETVNISNILRANDVITVTTSTNNHVGAGTPANAGTMVHLNVATNSQMNGWYAVCSVTNATTFTLCNTTIDTRSQGSFSGDQYNQATGTVSYYVENHISVSAVTGATEYLIYYSATNGGTYNLIGATHPQGISNGYQDLQFADYGSTFLASQRFPTYYPATDSGGATNDMLTGIVQSGGATTSIVLNVNASQNASGQFATYDAAPGIVAAAKFANFNNNGGLTSGYVYIPGNSAIVPGGGNGLFYPTFSPLLMPTNTSIIGTGTILPNEPIILQGGTTWTGQYAVGFGVDQFGWGSWESFGQQTSTEPVFILKGAGNHLDHMQINNNLTNGGHGIIIDNADDTTLAYFDFGSGQSASDYLSLPLIIRDTTQTATSVSTDHVAFDDGPNQVVDKSWTPAMWIAPGESSSGGTGFENIYTTMKFTKMNRRGLYISNSFPGGITSNGPGFTDINWVYRQGGELPLLAVQQGNTNSLIALHNISLDTENNPVFACIVSNGLCGTLDLSMTTGGNAEALLEGARVSSARISLFGSSGSQYQSQLQNRDGNHQGIARAVLSPFATSGSYLPSNFDLYTFFEPVHIVGGQSLYFDMAAPTNVTPSVSAGGSVPVASPIYYAVSAVGPDSGETIVSLPSSAVTTTPGNQTVGLTWVASTGAVTYNVYRCTVGSSCILNGTVNVGAVSGGLSAWQRMALHVSGTSYSDTAASSTPVQPPFVTGTGTTVVSNTGITTQNLTVNGSCTGCSSTNPLSGMTAAQVPIAASATTVTSSKAISGAADTLIMGASTISGTGAALCTDANGGATTSGCTGANGLSGMTATQIPVAATATTVTSSKATTGSGNVVLATSPTLVTPTLGAAVGTSLNLGATAVLSTTAQSGTGSLCMTTSCAMTTPSLGAATATSLLASGIIDGTAPITATTGATATIGAGTFQSGYTFNQNATAAAGVTYTLPATVKGAQYCVKNSIVSGSGAPDTGILTVYPPASSFVILNGVINTVGGGGTHGVVSGGAAADTACFVAIDSTHWDVWALSGTWSLN